MDKAKEAHMKRREAMLADFKATALKVSTDFGCDSTCLTNCVDTNGDEKCFESCKCGQGVIKITEQKVNTFSIVKASYGDLNNLSSKDIENINQALYLY